MKSGVALLALTAALASTAASSLAQETPPAQETPLAIPPPAKPTAVLAQPVPQSRPLSLREKYVYTFRRTFGPEQVLTAAAGAGFDAVNRRPDEWGTGGDAYAVRFASNFGQNLVKQHIAFAVRAIDHEDPRFVPSHEIRIADRVKSAILHTFVVRGDSGKTMPAYSRFVSDYGAAFISRQWWPARYQTASEGFRAGSVTLALEAPLNVAREFLPDLVKKLRH